MRQLHGDKVVLKAVPIGGGGLLSKLRRAPSGFEHAPLGLIGADDAISALETRALWARFGI